MTTADVPENVRLLVLLQLSSPLSVAAVAVSLEVAHFECGILRTFRLDV
jgi:hypothetical protein